MAGKNSVLRKPYKVFISSTYLDNEERRRLVQDAITSAGMVWHGMEIFTASTQTAPEKCVLLAKEADLLVGVIARRYGWEPDNETSITEMEYDAAKESLIFIIDPELQFSEKDFDQGADMWDKQKKLAAFKDKIQKNGTAGFFNETTLQHKVYMALIKWRETKEFSSVEKSYGEDDPAESKSDIVTDITIHNYSKKARSCYAQMPVAGFVTQLKVAIDIKDIFEPLRAMVDLQGDKKGRYADSLDAEKCLNESGGSNEISLLEAFYLSTRCNQRGLVILGDPGSGKTTHLKRLLLYCLDEESDNMGLPKGILPIFLPLRDLRDLDSGLETFIEKQLDNPLLDTPKGFGEKLLKRGKLLLLLDGLDEVADITQREKVAEWITNALKFRTDCWFVVTCRFAGYSEKVRLSKAFLELHVRPFNEEQAERFIKRWYSIVEGGQSSDSDLARGIATAKANNLITSLKAPDFRSRRVFELTRNPLLLANICLVHRHRGTLPKKRARLYEECIDVLLEHWRGAKDLTVDISAQEGRRVLQPVALWLHDEDGRTRATVKDLEANIEPSLQSIKWEGGTAEDFLSTIRDQSGLLTGWGIDEFGFMHLGFQEYLAAREIRRLAFTEPDVLKKLASRFGQSWWREVGLLLLSLEDPSLFTPYMREVVKHPEFAKHSELVDACLEDASEVSMEPFIELLGESAGDDKGILERQLAAFRVLKRFDANAIKKFEPKLYQHPLIAIKESQVHSEVSGVVNEITAEHGGYKLIKIPGGEFMMGSPKSEKGRFKQEGPLHRVKVPDFYMGIYPVTNNEYGLFLKNNRDVKEPEYWADKRFNRSDQPVVGVSWNETKLYAKWAGLRLPSEAEWEYACRAGTVTRFYSGDKDSDLDKVGWYTKNSGGQTHPVGEKLANKFGIYDMHGNAWEWVEDHWFSDYNGAPGNGDAWVDEKGVSRRVVRGGGWRVDARVCRSAMRYNGSPYFRNDNLGFRLSRSVSLGT